MALKLDQPPTTAESPSVPAGPGRAARAVLVAVVVLPIVTAVVRSIRRSWFPIGDNALLYIRAADVLTPHHPLLGSWTSASRIVGENMNNPGPTYDLLIAPFAILLPPGPGAAIGVASVNIAAIIGISLASRHIGGWAMQRWMLLAAAGLAWTMGSELLIDIWQPHALLLPFLLFLVLMVGCAAGMGRLVPVTVGVGTLLIQTHISYVYILGFLILAALGTVWWQHRPVGWRELPRKLRSRTTAATIAVIAVLWAHPLYEQFFSAGRGNLTRLVSNVSGGSLILGWTSSTKITGAIMALPWWWTRPGFSGTISGKQPIDPSGSTLEVEGLSPLAVAAVALILLTVALALLTRAAHRRGLVAHTAAGALATASIPSVVISLSRLTIGPVGLAAHHVRWVWGLAVFVTFVAVWIAVDLWSENRSSSSVRWLTGTAIGLTVFVSALNLGYKAHPEGPVADYDTMPAIRRVFPEIGVLADRGPILFDISNLVPFEPYSTPVMMRMQELGIEFRTDDVAMARQLGPSRLADGSETTTVFQLQGVPALDYEGPACAIALTSDLSVEDEQNARTNSELFASQIIDGTIEIDDQVLGNDERLDQLGAAREGDFDAAWLLVIDSTLQRWITDGTATSDNASLASDVDQIVGWMVSSYGLFAEGPWDCPIP